MQDFCTKTLSTSILYSLERLLFLYSQSYLFVRAENIFHIVCFAERILVYNTSRRSEMLQPLTSVMKIDLDTPCKQLTKMWHYYIKWTWSMSAWDKKIQNITQPEHEYINFDRYRYEVTYYISTFSSGNFDIK